MPSEIPQFDSPGLEHRAAEASPRPGAYAVARDAEGRVLIVRALGGWFLPGGGIEDGEDVAEALVREVREETGYACSVLGELGRADQLILAPDRTRVVNKLCRFFRIRVVGPPSGEHEDDHEPQWVPVAVARERLTEGAQAWGLERALE